jgi:four helix bundle protein
MSPFLRTSLRKLARSVARLVEDFPMEDERGLAIRLLGAVGAIPTSLSRSTRCTTSTERQLHVEAAHGSAAEAGYLVGLAQEMGYGRTEQAYSAAGRLDTVLSQLRRERQKRLAEARRSPTAPVGAQVPLATGTGE